MRALGVILLGVVILVLAAGAGWLVFSQSDEKATITIDKQEIKKDTHDVIESSKQLMETSQ
jgi:hypothetical protein